MFIKNRVLALQQRKLKIFALFVLCLTTLTPLFITGVQASPAIWYIQTVDSTWPAGRFGGSNSIALDSLDNPHISYHDHPDLEYAKWTVTGWSLETVDSGPGPDFGLGNSIALDSLDNPHIAYDESMSGVLMYARWSEGFWYPDTVDWTGDVGSYTSIALDSLDNPHISYHDLTNDDLKYATGVWGDVWVLWDVETVDSAGDVGSYTSIALDSLDNPHISYHYYTNGWGDLKYAKWTGTAWDVETVHSTGYLTINKNVGSYTSIALDSSDNPHISYYALTKGDLMYARWNGTGWSLVTVDSTGDVGSYTSIALDSLDNPHISYRDETNGDLKYAKWTGTAWDVETVHSTGDVGSYTSIALDSSDNPHISYYDLTNDDLKYATTVWSAWVSWERSLREFIMDLPDDVWLTDPDEFEEFKKRMYDKIDETSEAMAENTFRKARAKLNDMKDEIYKAYKEEKLQSTTRKDLENIIDHIISSIETLE